MLVKRKVLHVDGRTIVTAKGLIKDNIFTGEYKFDGMTYGITVPIEKSKTECDNVNVCSGYGSDPKGFFNI